MQLALGFQAYAGRPLPPPPQLKFGGGEMPLPEKVRVLRLMVTILGSSIAERTLHLHQAAGSVASPNAIEST